MYNIDYVIEMRTFSDYMLQCFSKSYSIINYVFFFFFFRITDLFLKSTMEENIYCDLLTRMHTIALYYYPFLATIFTCWLLMATQLNQRLVDTSFPFQVCRFSLSYIMCFTHSAHVRYDPCTCMSDT